MLHVLEILCQDIHNQQTQFHVFNRDYLQLYNKLREKIKNKFFLVKQPRLH